MTGILFTTRGNPATPEVNNGSITGLQKNTNISCRPEQRQP